MFEAATAATMEPNSTRLLQRSLHNWRFSALAAAVRDHETGTRAQLVGIRPHDLELYRRLRQICGERRFLALAAAIRRHEAATGHRSVARRPRDHALYRRLGELEASPATSATDRLRKAL